MLQRRVRSILPSKVGVKWLMHRPQSYGPPCKASDAPSTPCPSHPYLWNFSYKRRSDQQSSLKSPCSWHFFSMKTFPSSENMRAGTIFRQTGQRDETALSRIVCCIATQKYLPGTAHNDYVNSGRQRSGYQWHRRPSGVNHMKNNKNIKTIETAPSRAVPFNRSSRDE